VKEHFKRAFPAEEDGYASEGLMRIEYIEGVDRLDAGISGLVSHIYRDLSLQVLSDALAFAQPSAKETLEVFESRRKKISGASLQ
jgi:hypothetical protein